jgi:hypothetical protein
MSGKRRWNKETQVRFLLVTGIVLSLVAYVLLLSMPNAIGIALSTLTGVSALSICFYALWSWNAYQKAQWSASDSGQDATR